MERRDRLHKDSFITVSGAAWLIPENGDFLKGSLRFFTERIFRNGEIMDEQGVRINKI